MIHRQAQPLNVQSASLGYTNQHESLFSNRSIVSQRL